MYLLDTNTLIYLRRRSFPTLTARIKATPLEDLGVSLFTVAELVFGVTKSSRPQENRHALRELLFPFHIYPFEPNDCEAYGGVRAHLEAAGTPIGTIDTFIAAQAVRNRWTLVTKNTREFSRVPGLQWVDWTDLQPSSPLH